MAEPLENEGTVVLDLTQRLATDFWGDAPAAAVQTVEVKKEEELKSVETVQTEEQKPVDVTELLKTNLGYESWDKAKSDFEELKKFKESSPKVISTEEEKTKFIEDLYKSVSDRKTFERIEKLDLSNVSDAMEIVKLSLKTKHSQLDESEIADMIQEQYQRYSKPVQLDTDTDEDYQAKLDAWKTREESIDRKIIRDAKILKPEIVQLKDKIVIPEIPAFGSAVQPSQEELEEFAKVQKSFNASAEEQLNSFKGFETLVQDKDVKIPVSFELSKEDKATVQNYVAKFAENLNANAVFADRWLNQDGSINSGQVVKDIATLLFNEKAGQKFANDAANQRLELYLKEKKQIQVNGAASPPPVPQGTSVSERLQQNFWG